MFRLTKYKKRLIVLIVALLWSAFLLRNPIVYYSQSFLFQNRFMNRLEEAKTAEKDFDLRDFREGFWDEIYWVAPYENPCDEGPEFKKWWLFCRGTQSDGEFKIFLLKEGIPRVGFRVLRFNLEFIESQIPKRIPREKALFKFDHLENFPTVQLHNPNL